MLYVEHILSCLAKICKMEMLQYHERVGPASDLQDVCTLQVQGVLHGCPQLLHMLLLRDGLHLLLLVVSQHEQRLTLLQQLHVLLQGRWNASGNAPITQPPQALCFATCHMTRGCIAASWGGGVWAM